MGRIDILVNCAGTNVQKRSIHDLDPEDWDRLMAINATVPTTASARFCRK